MFFVISFFPDNSLMFPEKSVLEAFWGHPGEDIDEEHGSEFRVELTK